MTVLEQSGSRWSTAAFGKTVDATAAEADALGDHLHACRDARGRWFVLRSEAASIDGFLAGRLVTTIVIAASLIGLLYVVI